MDTTSSYARGCSDSGVPYGTFVSSLWRAGRGDRAGGRRRPPPHQPPCPTARRGRGLWLEASDCDDESVSACSGISARLRRRLKTSRSLSYMRQRSWVGGQGRRRPPGMRGGDLPHLAMANALEVMHNTSCGTLSAGSSRRAAICSRCGHCLPSLHAWTTYRSSGRAQQR
jgi:hypothetical protein